MESSRGVTAYACGIATVDGTTASPPYILQKSLAVCIGIYLFVSATTGKLSWPFP